MIKEKKKVTISFITKLLGTVPKDPELYASYISSKAPLLEDSEQEIKTVEEIEEKGWTGFHRNDAGIFIYEYIIKGFLKAACEACEANGLFKKIPAYKKWFDKLVFVFPRQISLGITEPDGTLERPLRVMTIRGPRVALARSDYINEGREIEFELLLLKNNKLITWEVINQCLAYGELVGLGQWRGSGGYGRFQATVL
jgi:hypothetical protein